MAFDAKKVIFQLERNNVKIDPSLKAELIQHLLHPEMRQKIAQGAKQWQFPEHNVALTSAIEFLGTKGIIDPAFKTALHRLNSVEMEKIHKAGGAKGRAVTALKDAAKRKFLTRKRAA